MARRSRRKSGDDVDVDPGPPGTWTVDSSCAGLPEGLVDFFGKTRVEWGTAKAVCKGCPVRKKCLTYAIESRYVHGVWGGLDQLELRFVLGRDATGELWTYTKTDVKCPYCRGATDCERVEGLDVSIRRCHDCGFTWSRAERQPSRRGRRRKIEEPGLPIQRDVHEPDNAISYQSSA